MNPQVSIEGQDSVCMSKSFSFDGSDRDYRDSQENTEGSCQIQASQQKSSNSPSTGNIESAQDYHSLETSQNETHQIARQSSSDPFFQSLISHSSQLTQQSQNADSNRRLTEYSTSTFNQNSQIGVNQIQTIESLRYQNISDLQNSMLNSTDQIKNSFSSDRANQELGQLQQKNSTQSSTNSESQKERIYQDFQGNQKSLVEQVSQTNSINSSDYMELLTQYQDLFNTNSQKYINSNTLLYYIKEFALLYLNYIQHQSKQQKILLNSSSEQPCVFLKLEEFHMINSVFNDQQLIPFSHFGHYFPSLKSVQLPDQGITSLGFGFFCKNSSKFPHIKKIDFDSNLIKDRGVMWMTFPNVKFSNLTMIHLGNNQITDQGVKYFCLFASRTPSLRQVYLSQNLISDKGLIQVFSNEKYFPNSRILNMDQNTITDKGVMQMVENGDKIPFLQQIHLTRNKITSKGLIAWVEAANLFGYLKFISLAWNQIDKEGVQKLIQKGTTFKSLKSTRLFENKLDDDEIEEIQKYLEQMDTFPITISLS